MIRLFLVAPDNRLSRAIYAADEQKLFEVIRFRSFENALVKERSTSLLIVQWTTEEILTELNTERKRRNLSLIVYCPDLLQKTAAESETIRFALFQLGAIAVFSQLRELPTILPIIKRYMDRFPPPQKNWTQTIYDSLPWRP